MFYTLFMYLNLVYFKFGKLLIRSPPTSSSNMHCVFFSVFHSQAPRSEAANGTRPSSQVHCNSHGSSAGAHGLPAEQCLLGYHHLARLFFRWCHQPLHDSRHPRDPPTTWHLGIYTRGRTGCWPYLATSLLACHMQSSLRSITWSTTSTRAMMIVMLIYHLPLKAGSSTTHLPSSSGLYCSHSSMHYVRYSYDPNRLPYWRW